MKKALTFKTAVAAVMLALLTSAIQACSSDPYDTGDGSLSYMRADFTEAHTDDDSAVASATTDDGTELLLSPTIKAKWITAKNSSYRAVLYYNVNGSERVKPLAIKEVLVPNVIDATKQHAKYPDDPVTMQSAWLGKNEKYINLDLSVKTGKIDGDTKAQSVGIAYSGNETTGTGKLRHKLTLIHSQNGVPEYYSVQAFVSIPLGKLPVSVTAGDEVEISINTYNGIRTKVLSIKGFKNK